MKFILSRSDALQYVSSTQFIASALKSRGEVAAMQLLVSLVLCGSFVVSYGSPLEKQWQQWKIEHSREYADPVEEQAHRDVWINNYYRIVQHNRDNKSFFIAPNEFSDLVIQIGIIFLGV